jgi:hypothetical protein
MHYMGEKKNKLIIKRHPPKGKILRLKLKQIYNNILKKQILTK